MSIDSVLRGLGRALGWIVVASACGVSGAAAQTELPLEDDPLIGDRPDFTESAVTITPGRFQVEAGLTFLDENEEDVSEFGELLIRIGLSPRTELRLTLGSYVSIEPDLGDRVSGLSDASIGAKIVVSESANWNTAVLLGTTVPTGSSEFRDTSLQPGVVFAAERDLSDSVSFGTNAGYVYASADGERYGEFVASAAAGVALTETTGVFFELFGVIPESSAGGPEAYFFDAGVTRLLSANFQLDIRAGAGLNSAATDFFAGAGLIWRH